ncbi:MAG: cob(I)yrinic acid a,c-diamide adenosyltransferase [Sarcina ventriculi]|uniref:cob(I)yrinic acid a,c-diamide adenosyltransferase n=1 Tax=Sarcina ventriculi TaxID=1267 RepID=UPI000D84B4F0|nr:cob(I)yrinic acid a,c-diamide adenosyltransferase [Sarcina ventriculi]MDO4402872.1 cob(I)yrinic acid a,c-diamide adenosyltransferase [Clostridiaceae bacterium]MBU5321536.1 cob(I)yrinic acid a,c-diamide adenosyltransferase [Sarcina ventriculi]MCI5636935.1 cob(I)yrinic acid a,c-diamide adenosyltransferase [Sarcina ventriculi]MDD7373286.1 cob(I)yrinic acid a,c-diamide adenosyltransferase [Sarcina ventriculi]MDY7063016.1 cob(I)yrinic acid a,c-diamide adenosyltransferase [Sarcina ventriculi]
MGNLEKGYTQIYTGNGKGKTTAAMGLGFRACGDGMIVHVVQFLKSFNTGELNSAKILGENFKIYRFETPKGFTWQLSNEEKKLLQEEIKKEYDFAMEELLGRRCDVLILDEIMGVLNAGFIKEEDVLRLMDLKPSDMELILTGRNVPEKILEKADLVTEMKEIKHYYKQGVNARKGIEF